MKTIELTQGKSTIVDDADYEWLNQYKWYVKKSDINWYVARSIKNNGTVKTVRMHRLIMDCPPGMEVDHRNGDTFDNRRSNLRICTKRENIYARDYRRKK